MKFVATLVCLILGTLLGYGMMWDILYKPSSKVISTNTGEAELDDEIRSTFEKATSETKTKSKDQEYAKLTEPAFTLNFADTPVQNPLAKKTEYPAFIDVVDNWKKIPSTAFPRQIRPDQPVIFTSKSGEKSKEFALLFALEAEDKMLIVTPYQHSEERAKIHIDDTNFKEVLENSYNQWVNEQKNPSVATTSPGSTLPDQNSAGARPKKNRDGTIDIMVQSIKDVEITDITLDSIKHWGPIREMDFEGTRYWACDVLFAQAVRHGVGSIDADATALMHSGKVVKWVYASGMDVD